MSGADFWHMYGGAIPELQRIALRVLGCASGACAAERGHKLMNKTKSKVRNKLAMEKCEKLLYVQCNLRLLPENNPVDHSTSTNVIFVGGGDDEDGDSEEEDLQPDAWRSAREDVVADEADERSRLATIAANKAACKRSSERAKHMKKNPVPMPAAASDPVVRPLVTAGGHTVLPAKKLQDFYL